MAEELPDGTRGGYEGYCPKCNKVIKTNIQGNEIGRHECVLSIIIGFECSGIIRDAFAAEGWDAWSCDLKESERPGQHLQCDIREAALYKKWDVAILHPVCRFLTKSGEQWMFHPEDKNLERHKRRRHPLYPNRLQDQIDAMDMFQFCVDFPADRVAIENPMPMAEVIEMFGQPTQKIQPYWFGDPFQKTTCLWLKNLPKIQPEVIASKGKFLRTAGGKRISAWYSDAKTADKDQTMTDRSRTFPGTARAFARQWTHFIKTGNTFGQLF